MTATIAPADALLALEALIGAKRLAFKKPLKIAVAIAEHGTIVFDTKHESLATPGWDDHADLSIFSNAQTISDLLLGHFDPSAPGAEHLLLWSGKDEDWRTLISALSGGSSMVALRASGTNKDGKRKRR